MSLKISTPQFFAFFFQNLNFFKFFFDIVIIQVFQLNGKSPLGFHKNLMKDVFWPWFSFQLVSQIFAVMQIAIF